MPYIKRSERGQYFSIIDSVFSAIRLSGDPFEQVDYIGYFLFGVTWGFCEKQWYCPEVNVFNHVCKDKEIITILDEQISIAIDTLEQKDLGERGGELNFLMSAVIWGYLGDSAHFEQARYATRAYMRGVLLRIKDRLEQYCPYGSYEIRSYVLLRGVLGDVIDEAYRRRTAMYEDEKIVQNGDIWPLRVEEVKI